MDKLLKTMGFPWKSLVWRLVVYLLQQLLEELTGGNPGDKDNGDRSGKE